MRFEKGKWYKYVRPTKNSLNMHWFNGDKCAVMDGLPVECVEDGPCDSADEFPGASFRKDGKILELFWPIECFEECDASKGDVSKGGDEMTEYVSSAQLLGNVLKQDDVVVFRIEGREYRCAYSNSSGRFLVPSDDIFIKLKLDKKEFCTTHYGYEATSGSWPECKTGDREAMTRLVMALFRKIEGKDECKSDIGGVKMELKDVKKTNLKIAQQKFNEERANAEVEFAKAKLRIATDAIDDLDRQIKCLQERKVEHQKVIDAFA